MLHSQTKTHTLSGPALDWAVAKCEDLEVEYINDGITKCLLRLVPFTGRYSPSTDWAQGGLVIEREKICVAWLSEQDLGMEPEHYCVAHADGVYVRYGSSPLIAAMRCYVASKLGDIVTIPEELLK